MSLEVILGVNKNCDNNRMRNYMQLFGHIYAQLEKKQLICEDCPNYYHMRSPFCKVLEGKK